jgi:hypothetical protein
MTDQAVVEIDVQRRRDEADAGRSVDVREVLNAIFYVLSTGCQMEGDAERSAAEEHGAFLFHVIYPDRSKGLPQLRDCGGPNLPFCLLWDCMRDSRMIISKP